MLYPLSYEGVSYQPSEGLREPEIGDDAELLMFFYG